MAQVHVLTGPERRRRFSLEQKRAMVAAAFAPGVVVADVARRGDDLPMAVEPSTQGALVEALADLLLAALEREETTKASKGGDGEQQDHR